MHQIIGVPQNRERMILVALRKDLGKTFEFPPIQSDKSKLTLRHILDIPADVPNQTFWPYSPQAQNMVDQIPEGGRGRTFHMRIFLLDSKELEMI